jgi:hypothetical protein
VSFPLHHCPIVIYILILLLVEGQAGFCVGDRGNSGRRNKALLSIYRLKREELISESDKGISGGDEEEDIT